MNKIIPLILISLYILGCQPHNTSNEPNNGKIKHQDQSGTPNENGSVSGSDCDVISEQFLRESINIHGIIQLMLNIQISNSAFDLKSLSQCLDDKLKISCIGSEYCQITRKEHK